MMEWAPRLRQRVRGIRAHDTYLPADESRAGKLVGYQTDPGDRQNDHRMRGSSSPTNNCHGYVLFAITFMKQRTYLTTLPLFDHLAQSLPTPEQEGGRGTDGKFTLECRGSYGRGVSWTEFRGQTDLTL